MGLGTLDVKTRGLISKAIEIAYEQTAITDKAKWAIDADEEIASIEDFTLGYIFGNLMSTFSDTVYWTKFAEKIDKWNYNQLVKICGKKEADKAKFQSLTAKSKKPMFKIKVTEEEYDELRNMLVPIISQFRTKIRQEYALKKSKK